MPGPYGAPCKGEACLAAAGERNHGHSVSDDVYSLCGQAHGVAARAAVRAPREIGNRHNQFVGILTCKSLMPILLCLAWPWRVFSKPQRRAPRCKTALATQ